jgi:ferric-dicitrate binding protein FerR (iron transport regulator)
MAIAAMFLFIIGIGHGKHPRIITYTTDNGQRANILLPDGSTVILNVASRLDLPADFGAAHRALTLHGEGLFTVMHQGGAPFTVTVGQSTIRVLGTTFAVRRYNSDTVTKVAVREGRVAVHAAVVDAHQQVQIDANNTARVSSADPAQFSFATGMLTIDREPLKDAVAELDRWYDVDIRVQDTSVAMHLLQGTFKTGSVNDLAAMLEYTFGVRVVRDGRVLTLIPK